MFHAHSALIHNIAFLVDLLCPRLNSYHLHSLPSVIPFLRSSSTELLPSVPVISPTTILLVRLQPFRCSKSFASSMVNCLTNTCAWSSYLSLICYHQCRMPLAEPQHNLARLRSNKVSRDCPVPQSFPAALLPIHFSYHKSPCKSPTIYLLQVLC